MSVQLNVSQNISKGLEGQLADLNPIKSVSGIVEEALGIDFGRGVIRGTNDDQILSPSGSGNTLRGVTIHSHSFELDANNVAIMPDEAVGSVLLDGFIYVKPEDAVVPGDVAFFRYSVSFQVSTLTFDAVLVTSNTIDLDVDGVAMTQVTFNTNHATTMGLIAAQLVADFPLKITSVVVDGNTLEIISVTGNNIVIDSIVVAAGASQANGSWAVDRAFNSAHVPGRFRSDDGAVSGIANTAIAATTTTYTFEETVAADGIAKLRVK